MEWISVNDRLPKDQRLNAVRYCRTDTGQHVGIALSHYTPSRVTRDMDFEFNRGTQPVTVTHWMPLPESPK